MEEELSVGLEEILANRDGRKTSRSSSIPPTCLPLRKAEAGSITQAEVTEVVRKLLGGKAPGVDVVGLSWLTHLCSIAWRSGKKFRRKNAVLVPVVEHWTSSIPSTGCLRVYGSLPNQSHMCFVDLEKAIDHVSRGILWGVLHKYGVRGPLLRAVRSLYGRNRSRSLVCIVCNDVHQASQDLQQHVLGQFAAECEVAGMKNPAPPSPRPWFSTGKEWLALSGLVKEGLPQVEEFKYLGVLFMSEGKIEYKFGRWIGAASAVMQSVYWTVLVKKELSRKAKLSIYQWVQGAYIPSTSGGYRDEINAEQLLEKTYVYMAYGCSTVAPGAELVLSCQSRYAQ
ncbi:hypothetical protein L3Q82_020541 [Scortum barcoo]|uniref:Uncharacterized protein n=1 Tax=Scortum barcoo TaxID=214431 RepID=A0ACB8V7S4_9TELE|nr:hypothetical protein L3Q82_020541 [Scortum barcoo]